MINTPDESLIKFKNIIKREWKKLSEADTRSKIIDPLFIECLNWDENDFIRESNTKFKGYSDYIFNKGSKSMFIIEAKNNGISFNLPPNFKNKYYKVNGVINECKELIAAIEQTQQYCIEKGVHIGIVTNGYQYVIFEAFKAGMSWREGKSLVFNGHDDIISNWSLFFKSLNKNSVSTGNLIELLSEKNEIYTFTRPLDKVINKESSLNRNYLHPYVTPFINYIFRDITDQTQMDILQKCYVYEKIYKETDNGIKNFFYDSLPHYAENDNIKFFKEDVKSAGWFEKCIKLARQNSPKGKVILLLGGIGSGKTTFIHRFFNIILSDEPEYLWFYIDFKVAPTTEDKLDDYIYEKIITNYEDKYSDIIDNKLNDLGIVLDNNFKNKYVERLFAILKLLKYSVCIVLDNVDRCDSKIQENIFLMAEYLSDKHAVISLLSLREESYYRSRVNGVFDAYHSEIFHIPSPSFEKLILHRIDYIISLLNKSIDEIAVQINKSISFDNKKSEVVNFFIILKDSLISNRKDLMKPITHFITCISEGDMRIALDMFNNFLLSGNTKVEEMMDVVSHGEVYHLKPYQFFKSVILSDARYYRGNNSNIMNLFDINSELQQSHFLHLRILNYAFIHRTNETNIGRGYILINKLFQEADDLLISQEAVEDSLVKLSRYNLIKLDNESHDDLKTATYFKITATGGYYLTQLVKKFIYIDIVHLDTPICDINVTNNLRRYIDTELLNDRFHRTNIFIKYLGELEDKEFQEHPEYLNSSLTNRNFIKWINKSIVDEIDFIRNKPKNRFLKPQK